MRLRICSLLIGAICGIAFNFAQATPVNLDQWFLHATSYNSPGTVHAIASPDFLLGTSMRSQCASKFALTGPVFYTFWQLYSYDRRHHIALARGSTDQDSCALFRAPAPGVSVPDADLSHACTGRGLCIGSSYEQVLSVYGPPVKHGRHFVTSYGSIVPATALNKQPVQLPERITLVIDNDRVSSIAIYIDTSGLY